MIKRIVIQYVFPKVKFADSDDLDYSEDPEGLPQYIIHCANLAPSVSKKAWWKEARHYVNRSINQQRNDKNSAIKREFYGT